MVLIFIYIGCNGIWQHQIAEEIIWNRTINVKGGHGRNVSMDRYNEFINADFKGLYIKYVQELPITLSVPHTSTFKNKKPFNAKCPLPIKKKLV
jgi:hypothetical protein